eukprot:INCI13493.16.p1 GENE.INCI13493.16~~INCI13493.16.p1  ORF type:complete len:587 (+),score=66.45 INCI13493.16:1657-3417(+)
MSKMLLPVRIRNACRYTFLTGRYASRFYEDDNESRIQNTHRKKCQQANPNFNVFVDPTRNDTVAHLLQKAHWVTGFVGKFHAGPDLTDLDRSLARIGRSQGSQFHSDSKNAMQQQFDQEAWVRSLGFDEAHAIYWDNDYDVHDLNAKAEAAVRFIFEHRHEPFFLQFCPTLPHGTPTQWQRSLDAYAAHVKKMRRMDSNVKQYPPAALLADKFQLLHHSTSFGVDEFALVFSWLDDTLSTLVHLLEWVGLTEDTLFLVTTDHGSRQKASLYASDGTNIPLLARWPRQTFAHYHLVSDRVCPFASCTELAGSVSPSPELAKVYCDCMIAFLCVLFLEFPEQPPKNAALGATTASYKLCSCHECRCCCDHIGNSRYKNMGVVQCIVTQLCSTFRHYSFCHRRYHKIAFFASRCRTERTVDDAAFRKVHVDGMSFLYVFMEFEFHPKKNLDCSSVTRTIAIDAGNVGAASRTDTVAKPAQEQPSLLEVYKARHIREEARKKQEKQPSRWHRRQLWGANETAEVPASRHVTIRRMLAAAENEDVNPKATLRKALRQCVLDVFPASRGRRRHFFFELGHARGIQSVDDGMK